MNKFILITILAVSLFGCSKKSSPTPATISGNATAILGTWKPYADTLRIYQNGTLTLNDGSDGSNVSTLIFNKDKSGTYADGSTYTYSISNNVITFNHNAYTVGSITNAPYSQNATIQKITSDNLIIVYDDTSVINGTTERDYEITYLKR